MLAAFKPLSTTINSNRHFTVLGIVAPLSGTAGKQEQDFFLGFKSLFILHEQTVCMLLNLPFSIVPLAPLIIHRQTHTHTHMSTPLHPSSASPGCCRLTHFPLLNPNNTRAKKADVWLPVWVSAIKCCPCQCLKEVFFVFLGGFLHLSKLLKHAKRQKRWNKWAEK